jgi:hypothetical protein
MLLHKISLMLLVKYDHTFPLLNGTIETICLGNKVGNYITHDLNNSRRHLTNVIDNKKLQGEREHVVRDPKAFDLGLIGNASPMFISLVCMGLEFFSNKWCATC